jgi:hypothetical protein
MQVLKSGCMDTFMMLAILWPAASAISLFMLHCTVHLTYYPRLLHLLQVFMSGRMDGFMLLAMLWATVNAIPPALFFVYWWTKGPLLRWCCTIGQWLSLLLGAGECRSCHRLCCGHPFLC